MTFGSIFSRLRFLFHQFLKYTFGTITKQTICRYSLGTHSHFSPQQSSHITKKYKEHHLHYKYKSSLFLFTKRSWKIHIGSPFFLSKSLAKKQQYHSLPFKNSFMLFQLRPILVLHSVQLSIYFLPFSSLLLPYIKLLLSIHYSLYTLYQNCSLPVKQKKWFFQEESPPFSPVLPPSLRLYPSPSLNSTYM